METQAIPSVDESAKEQTAEEEKQLATLVRSSEVSEDVKEWKLTNFADQKNSSELDSLSAEVLSRMQAEMRPRLSRQTELLKKEAYDSAYQKGYQEGLEQGLQEGQIQGDADAKAQIFKQLEPKLEQFESILTSLKSPYDLIENKLYNEIVDLALHISETVLYKSVAENREWVLQAIHESIAQLPESKSEINIYLNPEDLAFLQISKPTISESWQLHENPQISVGSCIVKQDYSSIINDWKSRFDEVANQLVEDALTQEVTEQTELSAPSHSADGA